MSTMEEVKALIEDQGTNWKTKFTSLQPQIDGIEAKANRPRIFASEGFDAPATEKSEAQSWIDVKSGQSVNVLGHGDKIAPRSDSGLSVGRFLRGITCLGSAPDAAQLENERKALSIGDDVSGGYTVAGTLASEWTDLLRAQMDHMLKMTIKSLARPAARSLLDVRPSPGAWCISLSQIS